MKIEITYEFDPKHEPWYFAKVRIEGQLVIRAGKTWGQARERMLRDLPEIINGINTPRPASEEVDI